jgi:hypothetical protein
MPKKEKKKKILRVKKLGDGGVAFHVFRSSALLYFIVGLGSASVD